MIFFAVDVVDWDDDDDTKAFLQKYQPKDVLMCLFNKLKSISQSDWDWEWVWKLGCTFGSISKRYDADIRVYSWSENEDINRGLIFIFLAGYWRQADADINTLVDLANTTEKAMLNNYKWDKSHFSIAIEAIAIGYVDNKEAIENSGIDIDRFENQFIRKL